MNILKNRRLHRRTSLKSLGAVVGLPYLEAMWSKASAMSTEKPATTPRVGMFYFGIGVNAREFFPKDFGKNYTLTKTFEPVAKYKDDFTIVSGTWLERGGAHGGQNAFGTGMGPSDSKGISADQLAARSLGRDTRFESLVLSEMGTEGTASAFSHNEQGIPLISESDPRKIFTRLFRPVPADQVQSTRDQLSQRGSVLDSVMEQAEQLNRFLGHNDRRQVDQYFNSIRETEKQLEKSIAWLDKPKPQPNTKGMEKTLRFVEPENAGMEDYDQFSRLMYDLIALALQTDSTRVISYIVRRELSGGRELPQQYGASGVFHDLTHHNNKPEKLADLARMDRIYMTHWAYFLDRLSSIREGDSTLLDNTVLGFSSGMGMDHSKDLLPTVVTGGRNLGIAHQGHLKLSSNTPLSRVWHTMLDRTGVEVPPNFQDSTGPIKELIA